MNLEWLFWLSVSCIAIELTSFVVLLKSSFIFPEFPYVRAEALDKFSSFDAELGVIESLESP